MSAGRWESARARSACHEAGHAVAAFALGHEVGEVTLKGKDPDASGSCGTRVGPEVSDDPAAIIRLLEECAAVSMAGVAAVWLATKDRELATFGAGRDLQDAQQEIGLLAAVASGHGLRHETEAEHLKLAGGRAAKLLRDRWPAVEAVAGELLREETITGDQARSVIAAALARETA